MARTIFHVDMDAFFAAIAVLDDPSLRGKPLLIGSEGPRSVVTTASYEARTFGCHSAMPMSQAKRLCPQALVVGVPGPRIRECSRAMFAVLDRFSPRVQPLSVDEAFLDMTGTARLMGAPEAVAQDLKDAIRECVGLVASVGVAPNKFLAKLASDLEKPDGLTVIPDDPRKLDDILLPLPVGKIWGVGPATQAKLKTYGIATIADLRRLTEAVRRVMLDQAEQVGYRLRRHNLRARGLTVKIRFGDFQTVTRSVTFDQPTDLTAAIYQAAKKLFNTWAEAGFRSVRLIGVSAHPLTRDHGQAPLFPDPQTEKQKQLDSAMDQITARFGKRTIRRGGG